MESKTLKQAADGYYILDERAVRSFYEGANTGMTPSRAQIRMLCASHERLRAELARLDNSLAGTIFDKHAAR